MLDAVELGKILHCDYKEDLWYHVLGMKESNYNSHS